ncbi:MULTISPECIES: Wzz/FepE/Etk N-terminal domain-containing protein [unclassified Pseudomonas]|uniref:Wzz/FepE/Etk N-terminal domain-containing protein n=1 Tax=unclassified Pseudomonas TaxID=196821 RepID=UPI000C86ACB6|nr:MULTISPECIES: Wzz/FepE/Etk N-terminal domain-containing protein [unclassified Pseudomonas]PMV22111.1 chain-length determining protein [Pseudomonas sp. FW305-3-2-15-C-TSA2]PMV24125.1 chain-length determining protein [Pseudomonas sp. DP16D-L5]PMV37619.1 chain-length determining protein [Pseudomonas sp. FW305-3-2-15-A-LB2]PMV42112.1 chain-length determining protein [Pseudomonas sp. FW305-3-2-15-C-R2A1]PMV47931.1 chain-length determining protein [Pseudomonas sp. FW305-3-2-15-C-LB1]
MSSNFRTPPTPPADEIDLYALFLSVWRQKFIVCTVALIVTLLSGVYAFTITPEYKVSSILRPAAINELDALNRSKIYELSPKDALTKVGAALESYDTRLSFFRANQNIFQSFEKPGRTLEQSFEEFNRNSFVIVFPDSNKKDIISSYIKVEMSYPEGVDGVAILNGFVNYAISSARGQVAADLGVIVRNRLGELDGRLAAARSSYAGRKEAEIASLSESDFLKKAQLQDELKALRAELKTRRNDRIEQLAEAIGIAKSLNILRPTTPSSMEESRRNTASSVMRTEINSQQTPLYFMGVEALEAERQVLLRRKSDDFSEGRVAQIARELQLLQFNRQIEMLNSRQNEDLFLDGVEPLRAEAARLRNLNVNMDFLKLVVLDKEALEPLGPVSPNKTIIVASGLLLGVILGVIAAFIYTLISRRLVEKELQISPGAAVAVPRAFSQNYEKVQ